MGEREREISGPLVVGMMALVNPVTVSATKAEIVAAETAAAKVTTAVVAVGLAGQAFIVCQRIV